MTDKRPEKNQGPRIPIIVAIIGAIATLAAAFIGSRGGFTAILPGHPTTTVTAGPLPQVTVTVTKNPGPGSLSQPKGIFHQGKLILSNSGEADLDAPPSDPQWGVLALAPGDSYDIEGSGNTGIFLLSNVQAFQLSQATNSSCLNATGYSSGRLGIDTPPLKIGQYICVHTSEGRFSLLKILNLPPNGIVFYVKTFDGPNDK